MVDRKAKLNIRSYMLSFRSAFSLVEATTALVLLALICSTVLVVINRCMESAADSTARCQAFEVARENMETILASDSVEEMVEFGYSEKYPEIEWQTSVESFYEPISSRMWIRAVCSADYTDSAGQLQNVELTHWLTSLSEKQMMQMIEQKQKEKKQLAALGLLTIKEAVEYAGVDEQTIQQWVKNGMFKTGDGYYIKDLLDLYAKNNGNPPAEDIKRIEVAIKPTVMARPRVRPTQPRQPSPRAEPVPRPGPELEPIPRTESPSYESPTGWPDWMPPKPIWDSMTREEQLRKLWELISG
ncbi:MAG: hypothetical protein ACYS8Y_00385 [Planctomycetota bacterium]|jgi:hypothetical protein